MNTPTERDAGISVLNKLILDVLNNNSDNVTERDTGIDDFKFFDVAKAIERLVLQEKIDLLNRLYAISDFHGDEKTTIYLNSEPIEKYITELQNQLKQL